MAYLKVDQTRANKENYTLLTKICPFNAFEFNDGKIEINANCKMCKLCTKKGPEGLVTLVMEAEAPKIDKTLWNHIAVFIEQTDDKVHNVSLELLGKARELALVNKEKVIAVIIGHKIEKSIELLKAYDIDEIYIYEDSILKDFNPELYKDCLKNFIEKTKPSVILYGGTSLGRSLAPRVAAAFKTGLTADCTILDMKTNKDLIQNRPAFGGNIMAGIVCPNNRPQMATVRYKIFSMPEKRANPNLMIHKVPIDFSLVSRLKVLSRRKKPEELDISESEVLVAIGRGCSSKEGIELAEKLAKLLKGMVAVTRPLVEAGLYDATRQVGLSGRSVAPKVLLNFGISGAVQYSAGATGSELIVSCNTDPHAQIFDISHYGFVGDGILFMKELIKLLSGDR